MILFRVVLNLSFIFHIGLVQCQSISSLSRDLKVSLEGAGIVDISFGSSVKVNDGNEIELAKVQEIPTQIQWRDAEDSSYYTMAMVDPDAPSNKSPSQRQKTFVTYIQFSIQFLTNHAILRLEQSSLYLPQSGHCLVSYTSSSPLEPLCNSSVPLLGPSMSPFELDYICTPSHTSRFDTYFLLLGGMLNPSCS